MIRYFLARGDRGGSAMITEGLDDVTCADPPLSVQIATLYMKTYCTACKQEGYIAPRGPRWPGTAANGKEWALSGDINICGCNPPPIFYAERGMSMSFTSEQVAALAGSHSSAPATANTQPGAYDQRFRVLNPYTGQPLRDASYRIVTEDGDELEGRTDTHGYTERVTSDQAVSATLHVHEEVTPLNPDWDKYL
ncbi:MAG TPA: hypothetical protein VF534_14755 [Paraburkholderia sp.]